MDLQIVWGEKANQPKPFLISAVENVVLRSVSLSLGNHHPPHMRLHWKALETAQIDLLLMQHTAMPGFFPWPAATE